MSVVNFIRGDLTENSIKVLREKGAKPADVFLDRETGYLYFLTKDWELYPLSSSCCEVEKEKTDSKIEEGFEKLDLKSSSAYARAMEGLL